MKFYSDSDQSQLHGGKLGPEATKAKILTDEVRTYALNPDFPHLLLTEPTVGPEILGALALLKELHISAIA